MAKCGKSLSDVPAAQWGCSDTVLILPWHSGCKHSTIYQSNVMHCVNMVLWMLKVTALSLCFWRRIEIKVFLIVIRPRHLSLLCQNAVFSPFSPADWVDVAVTMHYTDCHCQHYDACAVAVYTFILFLLSAMDVFCAVWHS